MTSYREILRLHSQGLSQRSIAASCGCGKGTVQRTVEHAKKHNLVWPLPLEMTDARLRDLFSPSSKDSGYYKEPDFEWVHRGDVKKRRHTELVVERILCRMPSKRRDTVHVFCVLRPVP